MSPQKPKRVTSLVSINFILAIYSVCIIHMQLDYLDMSKNVILLAET